MNRVRITKDYQGYRKGDVLIVKSGEAKQLLKKGVAIVTVDMVANDLTTKVVNKNGRTSRLRTM